MTNKETSNSKKNTPDDSNANILRMLELRAIAMLMSTLIDAMDRLGNQDNGDIDLANTLLEIVNNVEYGNNPKQERLQIESMIANLKSNIKRCDKKLEHGGENTFFAGDKDRAYEFLSEMVRGIVDSTAILTDSYTKDESKQSGSNHHLEVQINFNDDAWVFEFNDLNLDESIAPGFTHAGGVQLKSTFNGCPLANKDERFSAQVLSLLALAIKKEKQKLHEIEVYKSDEMVVTKAKELAKVMGGDYTDYLDFLRRMIDAVILGDSEHMSADEVESTIRSILMEDLGVDGGNVQAIIDMLFISDILDGQPTESNTYH